MPKRPLEEKEEDKAPKKAKTLNWLQKANILLQTPIATFFTKPLVEIFKDQSREGCLPITFTPVVRNGSRDPFRALPADVINLITPYLSGFELMVLARASRFFREKFTSGSLLNTWLGNLKLKNPCGFRFESYEDFLQTFNAKMKQAVAIIPQSFVALCGKMFISKAIYNYLSNKTLGNMAEIIVDSNTVLLMIDIAVIKAGLINSGTQWIEFNAGGFLQSAHCRLGSVITPNVIPFTLGKNEDFLYITDLSFDFVKRLLNGKSCGLLDENNQEQEMRQDEKGRSMISLRG